VSAVEPAEALSPGQTLDIDVIGWSAAPRSDWKLATFFRTQLAPGQVPFIPTLTLASTSINNGEHTKLTVAVPDDAPWGSIITWVIYSYDDDGNYGSWPMSARIREGR
jgi:hypothetical protein